MATIGLGMPSIDIVFKEAGIQAIRRGKQGVVALILKDAATVSPHRLINIKDIPEELSDFNQDQIKKAFLGYQTPHRVYNNLRSHTHTQQALTDNLRHLMQRHKLTLLLMALHSVICHCKISLIPD